MITDQPSRFQVTFILEVLVIFTLICLSHLLQQNLGQNEVDVLPLARRFADPAWVPTDWYLNQPPGYRLLFQTIFGHLIVRWGFLATSILGRAFCYGLVATGLTLIGRRLGLKLPWLLFTITLLVFLEDYRQLCVALLSRLGIKYPLHDVAIVVAILAFFYLIFHQRIPINPKLPFVMFGLSLLLAGNNRSGSIVANEWMIGGLETKAIAYGLILIAIGFMLSYRYGEMALCLGIATSFHILAGLYGCLTAIILLLAQGKLGLSHSKQFLRILGIYLAGSVFAIQPGLDQLLTANPAEEISPSYVYVFLRLPHHLNPFSWPSYWWINLSIYFAVLIASILMLRFNSIRVESPIEIQYTAQHYESQLTLFQFTLISLIPFFMGLLISPFDSEGKFLQYYPFRFGDVMLPLGTYLLFACNLQTCLIRQSYGLSLIFPLFLVGIASSVWIPDFYDSALGLRQFPNYQQNVTPEGKEICLWIKRNSPEESLVITSPADQDYFTGLAERATVAKFKLFPQTKSGIVAWYQRLQDLSGDPNFWAFTSPYDQVNVFVDVIPQLQKAYQQLTTDEAIALMNQYQARYFLAPAEQKLNLP
ncbi:MAG: hypothetical protein HC920_05045, partial [Oscillatoriales cyanobacterium SM2_3_0]|nr:hypothetical protein [Oscillatoriales cyanobacterium SM2_3_0]